MSMPPLTLDRLPAYDRPGRLNAVIETPRGSRNKFDHIPGTGIFRLGKQLPAGSVFPFDFGFVPSTLAADGDPLDVLVLLESSTFPGCLVRARLIGVLHARQTERSGKTTDNPRLIAVAETATEYDGVNSLDDLSDGLVNQIVHFFVSYNEAEGKRFEPGARRGPRSAAALVGSAGRRRTASSSAERGHRSRR
jgi:inorganic pyrophosphatase